MKLYLLMKLLHIVGKSDVTITIRISEETYEDLEISNGFGWFSSIPSLTVFILHRFYCRLLYGIALYDHLLDDLVLNKQLVVYGGSKLGLIRRMLGIEAYVENEQAKNNNGGKTVQYSVRITSDFAESIKALIKGTGFYKNRTQFCLDAIYSWIIEYGTIETLLLGMRDEDAPLFRMRYEGVVDNTYQFYNLHNIPYFFPGYSSSVSDSKGWLDRTYVDDEKEQERKFTEDNKRSSDE